MEIKHLHVCLFLFFLSFTKASVNAQTYDTVTHLTGTQAVGNNNVTVTTLRGIGAATQYCNIGPYIFGGQSLGAGNFTFTFSRLVANVRAVVVYIGYGGTRPDIVSFDVNGAPYPLTTANIANLKPACGLCDALAPIQGGSLYPPAPPLVGNGCAQVNISGGIRSITISCNALWNGVSMKFLFEDFVIANNGPLCWGDTLKLSCEPAIVPGATYSWTGPAGFTSTLQNPVIPNAQAANGGDYIVKITSATLDTLIDTTHVVMSPTPVAQINFTTPVCAGNELDLSAQPLSFPGGRFVWSGPHSFIDTTANPIMHNVQKINAGVYKLKATLGICSDSTEKEVPVLQPTAYSFTKVICSNELFDFDGVIVNEAGSHYDTLVNANGCDSAITLDLVVLPAPHVGITANADTVCTSDTVLLTANGANHYTWYNAARETIGTGNNIQVDLSDNSKQAFVVGTAGNSCKDTANKTVYSQGFKLELNTSSALVNIGDAVTLSTQGSSPYAVIAWYPVALFTDQTSVDQTIHIDTTRRYIVRGQSSYGCIDSASVLVSVNANAYMPSAFSPNGDGRNDYFRPVVGGGAVAVHVFQVYDRWGKLIWNAEGNVAAKGWNGTCNGVAEEIGVYFYNIDIETSTGKRIQQRGDVTLVR